LWLHNPHEIWGRIVVIYVYCWPWVWIAGGTQPLSDRSLYVVGDWASFGGLALQIATKWCCVSCSKKCLANYFC
jgi:hypothetical protein